MDSELDRTYNPFNDKSNEEFENWLDEIYARAEAEQQELILGRVEMEVEKLRGEIHDF